MHSFYHKKISYSTVFLFFCVAHHTKIAVITNVIANTVIIISQLPSKILFPITVDVIIDGNLANVEINIKCNGFTGKIPPIYTNKSFGVPGIKNSIKNIISNFL